jgi:hypothetical protein
MSTLSRIREFIRCVVRISVDVLTFFCLSLRSSAALAAENLFLRKQLSLYVERRKKPRHATDSVRFTLAQLARFFQMARCPYGRQTRHVGPLASQRIPIVLEVEISIKGPAAGSSQAPEIDC